MNGTTSRKAGFSRPRRLTAEQACKGNSDEVLVVTGYGDATELLVEYGTHPDVGPFRGRKLRAFCENVLDRMEER